MFKNVRNSKFAAHSKIALGLMAFVMFVSIGNAGGEANATPGSYTEGGNVTIYLSTGSSVKCATAFYPRGGADAFCGTTSFKQYGVRKGDKFGANAMSYNGNSVMCRIVDDSTGDIVHQDFGYAGGAAVCMTNALGVTGWGV